MTLSNKWENACRLCSEQKNEMLSIFGNEGMERKVVQKLRACLPVLVYKTDPLPKQICQFCAARLDDAYEFREYCLSVYKNMHQKLLTRKDVESVQIFLDAMKNSPDPCQAQLWAEKARAPPPLVPLPSSLPAETPFIPTENNAESQLNNCIEALSELPCEVEIKEENVESIPGKSVSLCKPGDAKTVEPYKASTVTDNGIHPLQKADDTSKESEETLINTEGKKTSILEQVLTGNLTINDRKDIKGTSRLSSKWWCAPCNCYYKSKEILMEHMQSHCPRRYSCKKCSISFESVKQLAKHEATDHMKVAVDCDVNVNDCHQCDRQFVSLGMLKQHRLRDHLAKNVEIGSNTWCSLCNRFFSSIEAFQNHSQLHSVIARADDSVPLPIHPITATVLQTEEAAKEIKKDQFTDVVKSLTCPTCGKVCTQQSALSNHMRTHEPKRHKCDICGRSFGLFIRLAAHRMSEHSQQANMSPLLASVEHEEALNAEREAREARNRLARSRRYSEIAEKEGTTKTDEPPSKQKNTQNENTLKNVARCGICLQWFNDHTTMLTHLQTHSDTYSCKNFTCDICKKSFKERWQLLRHEVVHKRSERVSIYKCKLCNKTFVDKSTYKVHQKLHTEKSSFVYHCSKCNNAFSKEVSLLTHQCTTQTFAKKGVSFKLPQRHSSAGNTKKYKCSKCNESFGTPQARIIHMKTHTEKSHVGGKTGKQKNQVQLEDEAMPMLRPETSADCAVPSTEPEVEISEESTPAPIKRTLIRSAGGYRCGVCQSPFVLRELAVAHLRSAHPVMPYQCPYCKKRFTTQYMFTHHIKAVHPKEPEN